MRKIVECVPNFSEGRRPEVIEKIVSAIKSVNGIAMLDQEMDPDHNRAVISFVGEPEAVLDAAFKAIKTAAELIDLNQHKGEHPRIGATDVVPFVPDFRRDPGRVHRDGQAAGQEGRRRAVDPDLPLRAGRDAARPRRPRGHPPRRVRGPEARPSAPTRTARRTSAGPNSTRPPARPSSACARRWSPTTSTWPSTDLKVAERIAKAIRFRDGGYRYAKALGFEVKEKGCVQVSINMTDYTKTPLYRVFETVKREAARWGVNVIESEIVGLVPQGALNACARYFLQLNSFKKDQILENRLVPAKGLPDFLNDLASSAPDAGRRLGRGPERRHRRGADDDGRQPDRGQEGLRGVRRRAQGGARPAAADARAVRSAHRRGRRRRSRR